MKKILHLFFIFYFLFFIGKGLSFANIDMTVSPVRYEITLDKGNTTTKTIKLFNNTDNTQEVFINTRNATGMDENGQPKFVEEIENPDYHLANWITVNTTNFTIGPRSNLDIPFSITVPDIASPGGHYGAVFFNVKENSGGQIQIQKRIGVLILLKVSGVVQAEGEIDNIEIVINGGGGGWAGAHNKKSDLVGKLFKRYVLGEKDDTELTSALDEDPNTNSGNSDFSVDLTIDFSNKGNTHLKPNGTIEIVDEDGKSLKKIGKETIKNEAGAIVGEKVVDYIPINDEDGNVLPNENRKFKQSWDGFAYETIDENGKKVIKYQDPGEYYSTKNKIDKGYLMPWERIYTKITKKKLTAKIKLQYTDPAGKEVEFNSARDFYVTYDEDYVGMNRYIVIPVGIFFLLIFIFWIIGLRKKRKCPNCKKKVDKDMKICPYCGEHLKKKKDKD